MPLLSSFIETVRFVDRPLFVVPSPSPGAHPIIDIMRCPGKDMSLVHAALRCVAAPTSRCLRRGSESPMRQVKKRPMHQRTFFSTWLTNYYAYLERLYTLSKKVTNTERFSPESSGMFWIRA